MTRDVCIVHIEDEFLQIKSFASKLKDYVEAYHNERDGGDCFSRMKEIKSDSSGEPEWIVFEIPCPKGSGQRFRYIFVGPQEIPEAVTPFMFERRHFIIDVLRPSSDAQTLWATGDDSITSAREHGARDEDITIFTASQGSELQKLMAKNPDVRVIGKADRTQLHTLICQIVVEAMSDG